MFIILFVKFANEMWIYMNYYYYGFIKKKFQIEEVTLMDLQKEEINRKRRKGITLKGNLAESEINYEF